MAMNRIQFQPPGLSLAGFLQQYGTEAACTRALRRARWPKGFVCPRCGGRRYGRCTNRHGERMWQCSACRHQTSLFSGTIFEATKLPLRTRNTIEGYAPRNAALAQRFELSDEITTPPPPRTRPFNLLTDQLIP